MSVNAQLAQGTTLSVSTDGGTVWIPIKEIKTIKPSGAAVSSIDVTDLDSTAKEYRAGLIDNGSFSCDINILESDPGQAAALASFKASTVLDYMVASATKERTFQAVCLKFPTIPDSAVDGVQTGQADWQVSGNIAVADV